VGYGSSPKSSPCRTTSSRTTFRRPPSARRLATPSTGGASCSRRPPSWGAARGDLRPADRLDFRSGARGRCRSAVCR